MVYLILSLLPFLGLALANTAGNVNAKAIEPQFFGTLNRCEAPATAPSQTNWDSLFIECVTITNEANMVDWDTSHVTRMAFMFAESGINSDLSGWDVRSVTDMSHMFNGATSFNGDLSGWDVGSVTDMNFMFNFARSFNGDLSGWDVSSVTNMGGMFFGAICFDGDLSGWITSALVSCESFCCDCTLPSDKNGGSCGFADCSRAGDCPVTFPGRSGTVGLTGKENGNSESGGVGGAVKANYGAALGVGAFVIVAGIGIWNRGRYRSSHVGSVLEVHVSDPQIL